MSCCCVATNCVFTMSICCAGKLSSCVFAAFLGAGALRLILSSESLLFAWNSGCLNSHAYHLSVFPLQSLVKRWVRTYTRPVRVHPIILIILSDLVEIVLVQLADKGGEVAVFKVFWQDQFCKFLVLRRKMLAGLVFGGGEFVWRIKEWDGGQRTSKTTKLSPSLPHRTTSL